MSDETKSKLETIKQMVENLEQSLSSVHLLLAELKGESDSLPRFSGITPKPLYGVSVSNHGKVVEGIFDGENMIGPDARKYPVPPNYASKSKLVSGDVLKLTIAENGSFIYKQIGPVERMQLVGHLKRIGNDYMVNSDKGNYRVLTASVTYFKAEPGDEVTLIVPAASKGGWGAIENVIPRFVTVDNLDQYVSEGSDSDTSEDFEVPQTLFKREKKTD